MNKLCTFLMAALAVLLLMTGCSATNHEYSADEEYHCVICMGCHDNAPVVNLALVEDEVFRACRTGGSVTLIVIDGAPFSMVIDIPTPDNTYSESKLEQIATEYTAQVMDAASKLHAQTKEVDTLQALQLASRALDSIRAEEGKHLVRELILLDSCLSTQGSLSFVGSDIAALDPQQIVDQLSRMQEIPTLEVDVYVYSLGDVAGDQAPLSQQERENLRSIWDAILTTGGAKVHMRNDLPLSMAYDASILPSVSTVEVQRSSVDLTEAEKAGQILESGGKLSFGEDVISFEPGSGVLTDAEKAAEQLAPTAEYLCNAEEVILICGTTACWGGEDYCLDLSRKRGEAIRTVLMELGVDGSRLEIIPLGFGYGPFYTDDQNPDGTLNEDIAPLNRNVHLVLGSSELGQDILNHVNMQEVYHGI